MPYEVGNFDSSHYYVQWGGTLPGGDEWSCGLRMAPQGVITAGEEATILPKVATAIQTYHATASAGISSRAILTFVKFNLIGVDGKYSYPITYEQIMANVPGGSSVGQPPAQQVTLAVSLTTAVTRGPAHRGRFYAPMCTYAPGTDGRITTSDQTSHKTAANKLLTDLNAASPDVKVAVYSRKRLAPAHRLVTGVAVGRVLDTQRRRRNKLLESY